jgi:serine/threonine-protein kinase
VQPPDDSSRPSQPDATHRSELTSSDVATAVNASDLIGKLVAERYRVIEPLGAGGMGTVYLAEHIHMRKPVALKVLHRELTHLSDIVARFEREAIAAARITHPNVAAATDFGRLPDGSCYLVLEYVHGQSLRRALLQGGPFEPERASRIARQIALALAAAHEAGIVHRDLKPENVMLVDGSEADFVKVLDFGIAKIHMPEQADQPALTRVGTIFGTPEYMSPEQALGQTADARADLYSLGIIYYEMLTGRTPFADKELVAVMTRHMTETPPPLPFEIDPTVAALVMQLLAKRPSERPQTAQEVAARLEAPLVSSAELRSSDSHRTPLLNSAPSFAGITHRSIENLATAMNVNRAQTVRPSLPAWLRRTIRIGPRRVPLVMVLLLALAGMVLTLFTISIAGWFRSSDSATERSDDDPAASASIVQPAPKKPSAPDPVLKQARLGDPVALHALESRPFAEMDVEHWTSLARGRARNRQWRGALEAYAHALDRAPALARDGELLSDVRSAASDPEASAPALAFAAEHLKYAGVDIIYDVWSAAASGRGSQTEARAAKKLLDDPQVRAHASKALKTALELNDARGCTEYRRVLPKVTSAGDDRCLRTLRRLSYDRGCGLFGLGDCYACLRGNNALSQAIDAVKNRPGPTFR